MRRIVRRIISVRYNTAASTDRVVLRRVTSRRYYNAEKYAAARTDQFECPSTRKRDVIIVGGGHNGLVAAAYLAKQGLDVLVLERRHIVGGAAVTEEIVPDFKFSRASYLAGLLRNSIIEDLDLEKKYDFEYIPRPFSSFTPTRLDGPHKGKSLIMGQDADATWKSISQWSERDADAFVEYEQFLDEIREIVEPLLEGPPPNPLGAENYRERWNHFKNTSKLVRVGIKNRSSLVSLYELVTGSATQILDRWFESDVLKTTLACDAVIGAMVSPSQAGSAYVLLHHVMGEAAGRKGVWAYVKGGMGKISESIACAARDAGAEIACNARVDEILVCDQKASGVRMGSTEIRSDVVISGAGLHHTMLELLSNETLESDREISKFAKHVRHQDHACGAFKINVALNELPNFKCMPSSTVGPQHTGTIHFEESMEEIEAAYREAISGRPAKRPVIEMTIPSSLDNTLSPQGKHVAQLFVQYAPYDLKDMSWSDPEVKSHFVRNVFNVVNEHVSNFESSIVGYDALSPLDIEHIFGMHKGNIFHGSMTLSQLAYARPMGGYSNYRTPISGLYMCSASTHPGGGVMGAAGRNCSDVIISDIC